jgi:hypothetical protein
LVALDGEHLLRRRLQRLRLRNHKLRPNSATAASFLYTYIDNGILLILLGLLGLNLKIGLKVLELNLKLNLKLLKLLKRVLKLLKHNLYNAFAFHTFGA